MAAVGGLVPVQRFVAALGAQHALGRGIDKGRGVGTLDQVVAVDEVELVDEHVGHGQGRRRIGAGADGHPQIGLLGAGAHVGVEVDEAQPVLGTAPGELVGGHVEAVARGRARLGAELDEVVDVVVVGHGVAVASEQKLADVDAGAADVRGRALGHAEGAAQGKRAPDAADEAGHHGGAHVQLQGHFAAASPNFCTMVS